MFSLLSDDKVPWKICSKYFKQKLRRASRSRFKNIISFSIMAAAAGSYWKIDRSKRVDVKFSPQGRKDLEINRYENEIFLAGLEVHKNNGARFIRIRL
jgi:hypothetical protein